VGLQRMGSNTIRTKKKKGEDLKVHVKETGVVFRFATGQCETAMDINIKQSRETGVGLENGLR